MKHTVLVGRKWDNPDIHIFVSSEEIGIRIDLDDFIKALVEEAGNPSMIMTKKGLLDRLNVASAAVVSGMKDETARLA